MSQAQSPLAKSHQRARLDTLDLLYLFDFIASGLPVVAVAGVDLVGYHQAIVEGWVERTGEEVLPLFQFYGVVATGA